MITCKLHKNQQITEIHYEGDVHLDELVDFIDSMNASKDLPRKLKTIAFTTKANFKFTHSDLEPIVEAMGRSSKKFDSIKEAFIVDSPHNTVLVTTFKIMNLKTSNYRIELFSTKEAAFRWQGIDYLEED